MPIRIIRRKDREGLYFDGKVAGKRIRGRAQSNNLALAREEAAALEAEILRTAWHGERRGTRTFAEAVLSYLEAEPRSENHNAGINRLLRAVGNVPLAAVNQEKAIELKRKMLRPDAAPGTYTRAIVMPMRAVLHYAHEQLGWCDPPHIAAPPENPGRTRFFLPNEVEHLIAAAAPHLRPLLIFLIGTGARMAEAIELDWRDVDLTGARAIFSRTKGGKRRNAHLPPRVVAALANLSHREGPVFQWETKRDKEGQVRRVNAYIDRGRRSGGQIKTGWAGALRRAGLAPDFTPHDLRHSWASWHYALHKDLLRLKSEGGWSSVLLVERYAHLLPAGQEEAIGRFLSHHGDTGTDVSRTTA
jgi:integrase